MRILESLIQDVIVQPKMIGRDEFGKVRVFTSALESSVGQPQGTLLQDGNGVEINLIDGQERVFQAGFRVEPSPLDEIREVDQERIAGKGRG